MKILGREVLGVERLDFRQNVVRERWRNKQKPSKTIPPKLIKARQLNTHARFVLSCQLLLGFTLLASVVREKICKFLIVISAKLEV